MVDVSFIVPAWNEAVGIRATLDSLRAAGESLGPRWSWEILVVDNASTDGTTAVAMASGARVVPEPHRQIARARNRGAGEAGGRFLVFVDADTLVAPELVREAVEALVSGAVGGGSILDCPDADPASARVVGLWNRVSVGLGLAAGAFVFCRREAWAATGGFDETRYAGEEVFFSMALKRWGRARGRDFCVLTDHPVRTSARKFSDGWGRLRSLAQMLLLMACPPLARTRWACFSWYRR